MGSRCEHLCAYLIEGFNAALAFCLLVMEMVAYTGCCRLS